MLMRLPPIGGPFQEQAPGQGLNNKVHKTPPRTWRWTCLQKERRATEKAKGKTGRTKAVSSTGLKLTTEKEDTVLWAKREEKDKEKDKDKATEDFQAQRQQKMHARYVAKEVTGAMNVGTMMQAQQKQKEKEDSKKG